MPLAGFPAGPDTGAKLSGTEPMAESDLKPIFENANFKALVRERSSFGWTLTIIMLVIYSHISQMRTRCGDLKA